MVFSQTLPAPGGLARIAARGASAALLALLLPACGGRAGDAPPAAID